MNNIIVGMGEALWDVLPEGKKIGGAPANFAYHVSQFGFDSRVVSAVGNDELGDEIMEVFKEKQLKNQIERVDYPTGTVQVTLDDEGVPCYEIKEGVAWDNIPFTDELKRLALNTRAVCFGSLAQRNEVSRATINRFLDTMPDIDGQLKIFDINLRQDFYTKEVLRESFKRCNILKINDEELVTISRMFGYPGIDLQDKCWILLAKYNLKMLILTCGINGSYVFTPGVVSFQETPKVPVADTVGAGDSFTAAFCASILNGKSVPEAHKLAVEVSAYVCTQSGAMPELFINPNYSWQLYYSAYVRTYIERDVRELSEIGDTVKFTNFMIAAAASTGQLVNVASLARDVGISAPTAERWLSILVASNIVYLLQPYSNNVMKRAIKTPKLYFLDTGLAAYLTRWNSPEVLKTGAMAGAFFESFVISEIIKSYYNAGISDPPIYFYRDKDMNEIDLLIENNGTLYPIEIKKHADPQKSDAKAFKLIDSIPNVKKGQGGIVCLYDNLVTLTEGVKVIPIKYL